MQFDGIGSSVVIALAAVLWFVYLVPIWLRRREYLATERNAVRLQQTMRIMAESAEVPDAVRVEVSARSVAAQQKALRAAERARAAEARERAQSIRRVRASMMVRLRRTRLVATLLLVTSLVGVGLGLSSLVAAGEWLLLATSAGLALSAVAVLNRVASVARRVRRVQTAAEAARPAPVLFDAAGGGSDESYPAGWTPVPVPAPLYLSRASVLRAAGVPAAAEHESRDSRRVSGRSSGLIDPAAELAMAAAEAELALRAAQDAKRAVAVEQEARRAAQAERVAAQSSPFARMGVLDEAELVAPDLDEIMRRRIQRAG